MANLKVLDGDGSAKYLKATGAGSDVDPHVLDRSMAELPDTAAGDLAAIAAAAGTTTGAAVVTDAVGTLQQYLRGLVKLLVAKITVALDQTTPGTTNGVVVNSGTVTTVTTVTNLTNLPSDVAAAEAQALGKGMLVQGDDGTDRQNLQVTSAGDLKIHSNWTPALQADEAADDSDKTFTVPASTEWQLLWVWIELIATATVGARQLELQIQDSGSDVILRLQVGVVQVASATRYYLLAPGMMDLLARRDTDFLTTPIPPGIILPAGYEVRIWDNNAVDAAADDMVVQMMVSARTV